jgi:DNA invertase Pin-like site-specific DNA recombinase
VLPTLYDDGGYSGGTMERPALQRLLADIEAGQIDVVVVYKVDRLTRALSDFAKLVEVFDRRGVSFVSITQQFNTTTSMGRLTLNILLSFAQFERELIGERVRDKIAASKKKGMWRVARCHSDTMSKSASSSSTRPRLGPSLISTNAISSSGRSVPWGKSSPPRESGASDDSDPMALNMVTNSSRMARSI